MLASPGMDESNEEQLHPAIRGLKTVCRCNNIKYKTIERAIRQGAHTLHQIAARTTATTGHCGGSCTMDVLEMLEEHAPAEAPPASRRAPLQTEWWIRKP